MSKQRRIMRLSAFSQLSSPKYESSETASKPFFSGPSPSFFPTTAAQERKRGAEGRETV